METVQSNEVVGQVEAGEVAGEQVEETGVVTGLPKAKRKFVKSDVFLAAIMSNVAAGKTIADVAKETGLEVATVEQRISKMRSTVAKSDLTKEQKEAFKAKTSFKRGSTGPRTSAAGLFALSGIVVEAPAVENAEAPADAPAA